MKFITDYKLEDFILNTTWESLPDEVRGRMRGCLVDLFGALITGSRSRQFKAGLKFAKAAFGTGDIPVIGAPDKFSFAGAACAMGHSSNAYDIDDGHNLTRTHPGTSFIGALLSAGYEKNITLGELLCTMYVSYEATIRMGAALMDYYKYAHSSGTFGAVGVCAGVGRIYGFSREKLNNAISVAEFNAPLVPGIRSVEYPSMNKDGVPFGVIVGALALIDTECGFEGCPHMLEAEEYRGYIDDLGVKHQVMDLYFKPYPCCRWAHPAIDACIGLISENGIDPCEIERVVIYTFNRATRLSKILPKTEDEAQYNIAYPVASAIVRGDFGLSEISEESYSDQGIIDMMARLSFETDPALDAKFPAKRICRAEITLKNGDVFRSPECEPRGEAHENIGADWLCDKFRRLTAPVICGQGQEDIISAIFGDVNISLRSLVDKVNSYLV